MNRKKMTAIFMGLFFIGFVALSGCSQVTGGESPDVAKDTVKIGVTGPLTGETANTGIAIKEGMELAVKEWNDQGGIEIDGQSLEVEMIFEDNQGQPSEGVSAAEKLLNNDNVDFLIGDAFASSVTMAIMDLAPQYEMPILSGASVSGEISRKVEGDPEKYKYFWKGQHNSSFYGESVYYTIESLVENGDFEPGDKTVAFVMEDTDYGRSIVDDASRLFEENGWEIVSVDPVSMDYTDFYPQLTKIQSLNPDVLVSCFTSVSSGVALVKQFQETGVNSFHMGVYYPIRTEFLEQAQGSADGLVWAPLTFAPSIWEDQKIFAETITEHFDFDISSVTNDHAVGYDTMNNALTAIDQAQSLDPDKIVEQLSQLQRRGLLGTYEFDQSNHTAKGGPDFLPVPASQIQNGKNVAIWPDNVANGEYQPQPWVE